MYKNITNQVFNNNISLSPSDLNKDITNVILNKLKKNYSVPFVMGVGGSIDVIAGKVKRAPLWMQKYGLEWLFRLIQEPKRMWKRYLITNTEYVLFLIKNWKNSRKRI